MNLIKKYREIDSILSHLYWHCRNFKRKFYFINILSKFKKSNTSIFWNILKVKCYSIMSYFSSVKKYMATCKMMIYVYKQDYYVDMQVINIFGEFVFKIGYASNDIMNARCNIIVLTNNLFVSTCELIMLTCDRVMWTPVWIFPICDLFMSMCEITMLHFNFLRIYVMWCNATYWCLLFVNLHATKLREV